MGHGLEKHDKMFSFEKMPWHGLGEVLKKRPKSINEALKKSGQDFEVVQVPVKITYGGKTKMITGDDGKTPRYFVNVRDDIGLPLGIVTKIYKPVQNREAFEFLAAVFGSEMHFETAGTLQNGRRTWVLMKLPEWIEVAGDQIVPYSFIQNSHDGKSSVLAACTPICIVCANTLGAAVSRAKGQDAQRTYNIRHLGNMSKKIEEARNVLGVTINYYEQFKFLGDKLGTVKISDKRAKSFTETLLPVNDNQGDRAARNVEEARAAVMSIFKDGTHPSVERPGRDNTFRDNSKGTMWALYNAATEYADWCRPERVTGGRWKRAIDDPDGTKSQAWNLTLEYANLS